MQIPDIATAVSPEKALELLPLPYVYKGLSVQGASPTRLTPPVPTAERDALLVKAYEPASRVKRLIGSEIAIARVGLGLRPAARTVSAHVQAAIFFAGLARKVASSPEPSLTPKPAPLSDDEEVWLGGDNYCATSELEVEL